MNGFLFFTRAVIAAAVVTFLITGTFFFAIGAVFATAVTFLAGIAIFHAAVNRAAAAATAVYGFAVIAMWNMRIFLSLHHGKGTSHSNAECNKYYPFH